MENKDTDAPEQEPDIVGDAPPVASSKNKKVNTASVVCRGSETHRK